MKQVAIRTLVRAYDITAIASASYLSILLATFDDMRLPEAYMSFSWLVLALPVLYAFYLHFFKLYDLHSIVYPSRFLPAIFKSTMATFFAFNFFSFFIMKYPASRRFIVVFFVIAPLLLLMRNKFLVLVGYIFRFNPRIEKKVLVVGEEGKVEQFSRILTRTPFPGLTVVGKIIRKERDDSEACLNKQCSIKEIASYLDENSVDEVVFCTPKDWVSELNDAMVVCSDRHIPFQVYANFFSFLFSDKNMEELLGIPVYSFQKSSIDPISLMVKRLLDIIASAILLIMLAPIFVIVSCAIKATMPGPIFFSQKRSGKDCKEFSFYKFRSMVVNADQMKENMMEHNEIDGPVFKIKEDPRITNLGRLIRKFSIDELPQLWNVFKGDMSLVGPRPPIPLEVDGYEPWQRRRLSVRPGISCIWQVCGRSNIGFDDWMKMDLYYVDNWSLWLDLKILCKTVPVVISGDGAY